MRRPIIMGGNPYITDVYKKDAKALFDDTGGNSGNLAFQYAIASHMRGNVQIMSWGSSPAQVRAAGDILVLPLANQLGAHTDMGTTAARLEEFGLPVIGIGLGAQATSQSDTISLKQGTISWLNTLGKLAAADGPNIGARGAFTVAQIDRLGRPGSATVTGCPSNFINTSDITKRLEAAYKRRPTSIAVTAGIPYKPALAPIERDLADLVTTTGGIYIVQHGLEMLRLARAEFDVMESATLELCRSYIAPQLRTEEFKTWCRRYAYAFYDARAWMDSIRRFDFVVGTRFHGTMLAIQAGVPAGCITHDSRTTEMCETMAIPHCHYSAIKGGLTQHNVLDYFPFDADKYRASREQLLGNYLQMFARAGVAVAPGLEGLSRPK